MMPLKSGFLIKKRADMDVRKPACQGVKKAREAPAPGAAARAGPRLREGPASQWVIKD